MSRSSNCKKGISNETFSFVRRIVTSETEGFTAADIAKKTGISSITVRKYLNRMYESGLLKTELDYGEIGRPQKLYYNINTQKEN